MTASRKKTLTLMACMGLCCGILHAATIVYSTANIANDTDGSFWLNDGTLNIAGNIGPGNQVYNDGTYTVNGIAFTNGLASFTGGGVTMEITGNAEATPGNFGSYYSNAQVDGLFSAGTNSAQGATGTVQLTVTLTGLTIDQEYRMQSIHMQGGQSVARQMIIDTTTTDSGLFSPISNGSGGALGAYASSTWTADATTQVFNYVYTNPLNQGRAPLNAISLHAIPEPSTVTLALSALLAAGLLGRRRMRG